LPVPSVMHTNANSAAGVDLEVSAHAAEACSTVSAISSAPPRSPDGR
jgi:hypothetical protein